MYDFNDPVVKYYDFSLASCPKKEIDYYVNFANEIEGPIVDLCCGTGILSLEIATYKRKVYGIDSSEFMLQKMKEKTTEYKNIKLILSDMSDFEIPERVDRIFCRDAFFHSLTPQAQRSTLLSVIEALNPGGVFSFNIHVPNPKFLIYANSEESKMFEERGRYSIPGIPNTLLISQALDIDLYTQIITTQLRYEVLDDRKQKISEEYSSWKARYTFPWEMFYLLEISGFKIRDVFGSYDKKPWTIDSMLIIEAKKIS